MQRKLIHKGFTLVEILVGMVVVVAISAAGWLAVTALRGADEITQNRIMAVNLLRKSQEEVRKVAQNNFTALGTSSCDFTNGNACGFDDITTTFPGFTRTLTVTDQGTNTFKRILIDVTWNEFGLLQNLQSVLLLAQPPDPLPGNLVGRVTADSGPNKGNLISGVQIRLGRPPTGTPITYSAASAGGFLPRTDGLQVNYDFVDAQGQFQLSPVTWTLTATHPQYENFGPVDVDIGPNTESIFNFEMVPRPEDGHLIVRLINANSGNPVFVNDQPRVRLSDNGNSLATLHSRSVFDFTISFSDINPKSFTVSTENLYKTGFVGNFSCSPPTTHTAAGWSSAVVSAPPVSSVSCGAPWQGSAALDRFVVNPGETVQENAVVVPVPTGTVNGFVRDHLGNPVPNADIFVRWPDGQNYTFSSGPVGKTNSAGFYSVTAPAAQAMFSNIASNYIIIWARAQVPLIRCCEEPATTTKDSSRTDPDQRAGPLFAGGVASKDMVITTTEVVLNCGDASGVVKSDPLSGFGGALSGASVNLDGLGRTTDGAGAYLYQCPSGVGGYRIRAGEPVLQATKSGYYSFQSSGNSIYANQLPFTNILSNKMNVVKEVIMWPRGNGNIKVVVTSAGSGTPLSGAQVELAGPVNRNGTADGSGETNFNTIDEAWPPPSLVGNGKYNQSTRRYRVTARYSDAFSVETVTNITLNAGESKTIPIQLIPQGAF